MKGVSLVAACLLVAVSSSLGDRGPLALRLFNESLVQNQHTVCLDGSPSGYYFRPSDDKHATSWVFFVQGGGLCVEPVDCVERSHSSLGSSTHWEPAWNDTVSLLSTNTTLNEFAGFNHVWIRYCTGDCHQGMDTRKTLDGLQFSGHFQLEWALKTLDEEFDLFSKATEFVLAGGSAGGIAVFNSANYVYDLFPSTTKFRVVPQAGYFFPHDLVPYPEWLVGLRIGVDKLVTEYLGASYKAFVDPVCSADVKSKGGNPITCLSAATVYPYIKPPMFLRNNIFDAVELQSVLWTKSFGDKYLRFFGETMFKSFGQVLNGNKTPDAIMLSACLQHTKNLCLAGATKVNGFTYKEALFDWYFERGAVPKHLVDDCYVNGTDKLPCNPVCGGPCDPQ